MERQRQEDELKSRSTRKGQDSDQKRVCYYVLSIVPNFMFTNYLLCIDFFVMIICYLIFWLNVTSWSSPYSIKILNVISTIIVKKWFLSLSGYKPTKKFKPRWDKTSIEYTSFRSCRRNYCWYGPTIVLNVINYLQITSNTSEKSCP